jgi:hypothetical protein
MSLRQIATINRPFFKDNRLLVAFYIERWLRESKSMTLFLSFYEDGHDIPFVCFTLERAPNRPELAVLLTEDRDILGVYGGKDGEAIVEEMARNITNVEDAHKLEIEENIEEVGKQ